MIFGDDGEDVLIGGLVTTRSTAERKTIKISRERGPRYHLR